MRTSLLPPRSTSARLFGFGATVGPVVDSLHNQALLEYHLAPLQVGSFFCSSWTVPPLLGLAYVVLGGILPRLLSTIFSKSEAKTVSSSSSSLSSSLKSPDYYRKKAVAAVTSTAAIIKLSDILATAGHHDYDLALLIAAAFSQWLILDRTGIALLTATLVAIGGPLSELPFVAMDVWEYLPSAADYYPLSGSLLGLSSLTGPCYFAVTLDAIAFGRLFDSLNER